MTSSQYYQYIEGLARSHKMVRHSDTDKHFFRGELEEFYMDLRNKVKFPAMIAESWEITFQEENKKRETSFIIAAAYKESKNWGNIYAAIDLCERIGDEFLRRIIADVDEGKFCGDVELMSAIPMVDEQHLYAGVRYTIQMSCPFRPDPDKDEWTDL
ncbi:MAG: hypothetical protein II859_10300 [Bacteroidales bacterium]|nr:hypothetical protein [Bacteroidales bacterium]